MNLAGLFHVSRFQSMLEGFTTFTVSPFLAPSTPKNGTRHDRGLAAA